MSVNGGDEHCMKCGGPHEAWRSDHVRLNVGYVALAMALALALLACEGPDQCAALADELSLAPPPFCMEDPAPAIPPTCTIAVGDGASYKCELDAWRFGPDGGESWCIFIRDCRSEPWPIGP